jgi:diguanylate cyclase (GGDEF)-like protein
VLRAAIATASVGVCLTCAAAVSILGIAAAVPLGALLGRSAQYTRLASDARTDPKTGLLNIASWRQQAAAEIRRAIRAGTPVAVLLLDLDHFKSVNDTYGHLCGDRVLRATADALRAELREYDLAGRFGGEEFVVLLPGTGMAAARAAAERLRLAVAVVQIQVTGPGGRAAVVGATVSAGVAGAIPDAEGHWLEDLLAAADAGCYEAKAAGRNRVRTAGPGSITRPVPLCTLTQEGASHDQRGRAPGIASRG